MRPASDQPAPAAEADLAARQRRRQKASVYFAVTLLVLCAVAVIALPIPKIPFFVRVLVAAGDLIIAAVLLLAVRQKLDGK